MGPVNLGVRYRPLRIGWCIDAENRDDFMRAVSLSHMFWSDQPHRRTPPPQLGAGPSVIPGLII